MKIILKDKTAHVHMVDCKNIFLSSEFIDEIIIDCQATKSCEFGKIILNIREVELLLKALPRLSTASATKPEGLKDRYWFPIQRPIPRTNF